MDCRGFVNGEVGECPVQIFVHTSVMDYRIPTKEYMQSIFRMAIIELESGIMFLIFENIKPEHKPGMHKMVADACIVHDFYLKVQFSTGPQVMFVILKKDKLEVVNICNHPDPHAHYGTMMTALEFKTTNEGSTARTYKVCIIAAYLAEGRNGVDALTRPRFREHLKELYETLQICNDWWKQTVEPKDAKSKRMSFLPFALVIVGDLNFRIVKDGNDENIVDHTELHEVCISAPALCLHEAPPLFKAIPTSIQNNKARECMEKILFHNGSSDTCLEPVQLSYGVRTASQSDPCQHMAAFSVQHCDVSSVWKKRLL